ncbi:MAG: hypothetical protein QOI66_3694 [Myxococcales bacterium]|jgi:hypothetical protein|nr:hypothetical protein [Myxococcales bacterium]
MEDAATTSYRGWPADARDAVEQAIAAHGGWARWRATDSIKLDLRSAHGRLLTLKGYPRTFGAPRQIEIHPHRRTTIFHDYPDARHHGLYVDGAVSIRRVADGAVVESSPTHRATLRGLAKYRRWRPMDALYFFGYALWHYHVVPFTLGQAGFVRMGRGAPGVNVTVDFPPDVHTHSRRQRFFFGQDGRIFRHDYVADVIGRWARGSHFWRAYQNQNDLPVALHRQVVVRVFGHPTPLTVLDVKLALPESI